LVLGLFEKGKKKILEVIAYR